MQGIKNQKIRRVDNCAMNFPANNPAHPEKSFSLKQLWLPITAMILVVVASNYLVQFPINSWLTWGAFTFPVAFLVTDLTNRAVGAQAARRVAWVGFAIAVLVSLGLAPWRIAVASGLAFIVGQLLDITTFSRLRAMTWWKAPLDTDAIDQAGGGQERHSRRHTDLPLQVGEV